VHIILYFEFNLLVSYLPSYLISLSFLLAVSFFVYVNQHINYLSAKCGLH